MVTLSPSPTGLWSAGNFLSPPLAGFCGTAMSGAAQQSLRKRTKAEVSEAFIQRLSDRRSIDLEVPGVIESIQKHFQLLPTRYALDVNLGSLDVLNHKRLLDSARADPSAVSFQVRPVDVAVGHDRTSISRRPSFGNLDGFTSEVSRRQPLTTYVADVASGSLTARFAAQANSYGSASKGHPKSLPRPAFGSSPNLQVSAAVYSVNSACIWTADHTLL